MSSNASTKGLDHFTAASRQQIADKLAWDIRRNNGEGDQVETPPADQARLITERKLKQVADSLLALRHELGNAAIPSGAVHESKNALDRNMKALENALNMGHDIQPVLKTFASELHSMQLCYEQMLKHYSGFPAVCARAMQNIKAVAQS
jgi:hypothetical protein